MQENDVAFVIKNLFPSQSKIIIFTKKLGKVSVLVNSHHALKRVRHGSLILCSISQKNKSQLVLEVQETIQICDPIREESLFWIHHLLELCNYFIPLSTPSDQLFMWLRNFIALIDISQKHNTSLGIQKKIYILYFLELIGISNIAIQKNYTEAIKHIHYSLKENPAKALVLPSFITKNEHSSLNKRILQLLQEHPCFNYFKTLRFVYPS